MSLVTIKDVEIVGTGTYALSSPGIYTFTKDDLADAVKAQEDPAVKSPRLKIGHTSELGDGEPAFGVVKNMRLENEGNLIKGDVEGVPKWLADIMPTAYASRSIEGPLQVQTSTGRKYNLVIEAVSLLGVYAPGVSTLADLEPLYGDEMPEGVVVAAGEPKVTLAAKIGGPMAKVAAQVEVEDVRRAYYQSLTPDQQWWWIRAVELDPSALIVDADDGEGTIYRVPFDLSGDEISFGDPTKVAIEYTPVAAQKETGEERKRVAVYASRAESRPEKPNKEDPAMTPEELRASIGLPADASDDDVKAKLKTLTASAESGGENGGGEEPQTGEPSGDPPTQPSEQPPGGNENDDPTEQGPESAPQPGEGGESGGEATASSGLMAVDAGTLAQLQRDAAAGAAVAKAQAKKEKEDTIKAAVKAGKIPPARVEFWGQQWDADPEGAKQTLASLPAVLPVNENGGNDDSESVEASAYPEEWLSTSERERIARAKAGGTPESGRVATEVI